MNLKEFAPGASPLRCIVRCAAGMVTVLALRVARL